MQDLGSFAVAFGMMEGISSDDENDFLSSDTATADAIMTELRCFLWSAWRRGLGTSPGDSAIGEGQTAEHLLLDGG